MTSVIYISNQMEARKKISYYKERKKSWGERQQFFLIHDAIELKSNSFHLNICLRSKSQFHLISVHTQLLHRCLSTHVINWCKRVPLFPDCFFSSSQFCFIRCSCHNHHRSLLYKSEVRHKKCPRERNSNRWWGNCV